ncbi:MAG: cellulase family glycosylhydrolase [Prolixibacteraceae bacterium]|nr:cellulase family glycosylhydrolase [Prolixibacteraceae bacterium]
MKTCLKLISIVLIFLQTEEASFAQSRNKITINGTRFEMNGEPFEYTGISFFNTLYNPSFNKSSDSRREYLKQLKATGINVLRVWCQWDNARGFIDGGEGKTLYNADGSLKPDLVAVLNEIISDADSEGMVILLVLFSRESWNENLRLSDEASNRAVEEVAQSLIPFRNLIFQIWNEFDYRTTDYAKIIKKTDPDRLVTNSPGYAGILGSDEENRFLDFLSPHTTRDDYRHWEVAPREIEYLLTKYRKPVVDDEPARKGTPKFGGPKSPTQPEDHILHIYNVWKTGGYTVYHHDMFQTGYGSEAVPPNGIPLPGFSPYHDQVFEFLKNRKRYLSQIRNSEN